MKVPFSEYYPRRRQTDMMPIRAKLPQQKEQLRKWTMRRIREKS